MTEVVCFLSYTEDGDVYYDEIITVKGKRKRIEDRDGFTLVQDMIRAQKLNDRALMEMSVLALSAMAPRARPHIFITSNPENTKVTVWPGSASSFRKEMKEIGQMTAKKLKSLGCTYAKEV